MRASRSRRTSAPAARSSASAGAASSRSASSRSSRRSSRSRIASGRRGTSASSITGSGSGGASSSTKVMRTRASSPPIPRTFAGLPFSSTSYSTSVRFLPSDRRPRSIASSTERPVNSSPRSGLIASSSSRVDGLRRRWRFAPASRADRMSAGQGVQLALPTQRSRWRSSGPTDSSTQQADVR